MGTGCPPEAEPNQSGLREMSHERDRSRPEKHCFVSMDRTLSLNSDTHGLLAKPLLTSRGEHTASQCHLCAISTYQQSSGFCE